MSSRGGATALAVALAAALTGCTSSAKVTATPTPSDATGVICAKDASGKAVDLPDGFPAGFPLPPGTIITSVQTRGAGVLVISGVTAAGFTEVLHALQKDLPAKGFVPKDGEVEPHDAESDWSSAAYDGRWAIREIAKCGGDTAVSFVARQK